MNSRTTIRAGKTVSTKELEVVANFTNGFAEHVMELSDGTLIFIGYNEDRVRIIERDLINDPSEITALVNSLPEDN